MFLFCAALSAAGVLESVICSCLFAELVGYWLHRLLHSDSLPFLSRRHMVHHLLLYGPQQPMRAEFYKDATDGRWSLGNIGFEWLAPSAVVLTIAGAAMFLLHVRLAYQLIVLGILIAWPVFTFSILHDAMHVSDSWMERSPVLSLWFRRARRFHDIHHHSVDAKGHMNVNFGIGFFIFDRIFRTFAIRHRPLNRKGLAIALQRYRLTTTLSPLRSGRSREREAAFLCRTPQ